MEMESCTSRAAGRSLPEAKDLRTCSSQDHIGLLCPTPRDRDAGATPERLGRLQQPREGAGRYSKPRFLVICRQVRWILCCCIPRHPGVGALVEGLVSGSPGSTSPLLSAAVSWPSINSPTGCRSARSRPRSGRVDRPRTSRIARANRSGRDPPHGDGGRDRPAWQPASTR